MTVSISSSPSWIEAETPRVSPSSLRPAQVDTRRIAFAEQVDLRGFRAKFDPEYHPDSLAVSSSAPPLLPFADTAMLIDCGAEGLVVL